MAWRTTVGVARGASERGRGGRGAWNVLEIDPCDLLHQLGAEGSGLREVSQARLR